MNNAVRVYRYHAKLIFVVVMLGVVNHLTLKAMGYVLSNYIQGYIVSEYYLMSDVVFFFTSYAVVYLGVKYGLKRMLPYQLFAVTMFFPLIFLTSAIRFFGELPLAEQEFYTTEICYAELQGLLCGEALAYMAFSMAMRALPLMLIIPGIFYYLLKVNFMNLAAHYESL